MPEFGEGAYVNVRSLTAAELLSLQSRFGNKQEVNESNIDFMLSILLHTLVDDNGVNLFNTADEVRQLLQNGISVLTRLSEKAVEVSGLDLEKKAN